MGPRPTNVGLVFKPFDIGIGSACRKMHPTEPAYDRTPWVEGLAFRIAPHLHGMHARACSMYGPLVKRLMTDLCGLTSALS